MDSKLKVPIACQFIGMRWSYEELVLAQAKLNPLTSRQERAQREIESITSLKGAEPENGKGPAPLSPEDAKRLSDLKEALAVLSGLEAPTPDALDRYLDRLDETIDQRKPFVRSDFKDAVGPVTAEQLYINQKVSDLISNAEMEQSDYRRGGKPNVFFGAEKRYSFGTWFGHDLRYNVSVFWFNTSVMIGSTLVLLGLLLWILKRQLEVR